ncbi:MAG: metallophosphoesterase, partial [Muribaculaceae bacterium]|nr:metallophosphoesterase [Muribaculaceae bacterium]
MIRQLIFISVFAAAAAMAALAQNVTGTVTCGGAGVSGVAVSDGINVVTTDKQGRYA